MIKTFAIFKVTEKKNENQPDYRLSAKIGEKYVDIGAGWVKDGKAGKFISVKLSDAYKDRSGFVIMEEQVDIPKTKESEMKTSDGSDIPFPNDEIL